MVCVVVSLMTAPPRPEQVDGSLMIDWKALRSGGDLGSRWYNSVLTWWLVFVGLVVALALVFSGQVF